MCSWISTPCTTLARPPTSLGKPSSSAALAPALLMSIGERKPSAFMGTPSPDCRGTASRGAQRRRGGGRRRGCRCVGSGGEQGRGPHFFGGNPFPQIVEGQRP